MAEVAEKTQEVVEVPAPEAPSAPVLPTREELREKGWSAAEMDSAEKRGMIQKAEEKPEEKAPEKPEAKVVEPEVKKPEEKKPEARRGTPLDDVTLTPEQEKVFAETFGPGHPLRAFYFRAKNERSNRQRAEQERDAERKARQELEAKLAAKPKEEVPEDEDPEEKPLTVKDLKRLREEEAKAIEEQRQKYTERAQKVSSAQVEQEEYARTVYQDFDDTVGKAKEVMQNLDALLPEKFQQARALKLIRDLQVAAANADQMDLDDFNAAHIAYEIGRLHPSYGKSEKKEEKPGAVKDPKANGGRTPEEMERMKRNAQQRPSSASVPQGGGKRSVVAEEVTAEDLNSMTAAQRLEFRQKHPERYTAIVRG